MINSPMAAPQGGVGRKEFPLVAEILKPQGFKESRHSRDDGAYIVGSSSGVEIIKALKAKKAK